MTRASTSETVALATRPPAIAVPDDVDDDAMDADESPMRDGRNENSLAYLCQRFCEMYRNHSDPINIDLAAKELGIQRRRMYEILNIIQSVGLVGRLRASFYRWEGQNKMTATLERLKEEGMARITNNSRGVAKNPAAACMSPEGQRRKAVATALGERFVQIFLCNEVPQPVILEDIMGHFASCVGGAASTPVTGSPAALTNQTSCARRLYDIANVFCSIGLVRKSCSAATDNRRKKRLYVWIGPVPPATTTPLRPQRATLVAPSASPGSGRTKRMKQEPLETPPPPAKKKTRLNLEASILKAELDGGEENGSPESNTRHKVLTHPVVTALRGATTFSQPPQPAPGLGSASKRAMLIARALDRAPSSPSSVFNPPNAKDAKPLQLIGAKRPLSPRSSTASLSPSTPPPSMSKKRLSTSSSSSSSSQCECASSSADSPRLLRAQIDQLKKELQDAKTREQELLKRIEMQDSQINKLIDAKLSNSGRPTPTHPSASSSSSTAAFLLNASNSPLSGLMFSPFQARDAFASLGATPSPFGGGIFGSTSRPPLLRKARIGPHLIDPTGPDDTDGILLSPATTSIASSLLLSPLASSSSSSHNNKENRGLLDSPLLSSIKVERSSAPSTPPSNLIATAASSLLSLTPSQVPGLSSSCFIEENAILEQEEKQTTTHVPSEKSGGEENEDDETARANAASPEPQTVRSLVAAPSSPSPSARGARASARHRHPTTALAKPRCLSS